MIVEENKGGSSAQKKVSTDKIALELYKPIPANSFIHQLLYNPNFRKDQCTDCRHHKPMYFCLKCKAERHEGYVDVTLSGRYVGRFALDGQE